MKSKKIRIEDYESNPIYDEWDSYKCVIPDAFIRGFGKERFEPQPWFAATNNGDRYIIIKNYKIYLARVNMKRVFAHVSYSLIDDIDRFKNDLDKESIFENYGILKQELRKEKMKQIFQ